PLAVNTRQQVNYVPVRGTGFVQLINVAIDSQSGPVNLVYRTQSAPVNIQHNHIPAQGSFRATSSQVQDIYKCRSGKNFFFRMSHMCACTPSSSQSSRRSEKS